MSAVRVGVGTKVPLRFLTSSNLYGTVVAVNRNRARVSCTVLDYMEWVPLETVRKVILMDQMRKRNG